MSYYSSHLTFLMSGLNSPIADISQLPESDRAAFYELAEGLGAEEKVSLLRDLVAQKAAAVVETPALDWRSAQRLAKKGK